MSKIVKRLKVLIVDDCGLVRRAMRSMLASVPDIEVVGEAADGLRAASLVATLNPDVITLDLEMPGMDGLTFMRRMLDEKSPPVVVVSSLSIPGSEIALEAVALGAVEVVAKPGPGYPPAVMRFDLVRAVYAAASSKRTVRAAPRASAVLPPRAAGSRPALVALGASTGGTVALERVLQRFPLDAPPVAVVQHMPPFFTEVFARRLHSVCAIEVREAKDGDRLGPGLALVAPGGKHMEVRRSGAAFHVAVMDGDRVNGHCPSVDVMFASVSRSAGRGAVGALLTGMGNDGAQGLLAMREQGARTMAQNEMTCAVFGMPRAAQKIGATDDMVHLDDIAERILGPAAAQAHELRAGRRAS